MPHLEVIVGYSDIKKFEVSLLSCLTGATINTQSLQALQTAQSLNNITFNMTIEDQTETSTKEINFYNITVTVNSTASVNVSDAVTNYTMNVDINGDGTADQIIPPDSISINPLQPQSLAAFDTNSSGFIDRSEAVDAVVRFFGGDPAVTRATAVDVVVAFFSQTPV